MIVVLPIYPWIKTSEKERNLTKEKLTDIFKKYLKELGYENADIDYQTAEYFG